MSLQIWLPLNGNVDNQGLSDLTFSVASTNTTVNDSGKIGKCYENNSFTAGGLLSDKEIYLGQNQSMFCWFKINSLRSNSSLGGGLVTQHRSTMNQGMGITIRYVTESTGYLSVNTGNGDSRTYNVYYGNTLLQAGVWYHGGYTYDGTTIRLYVNGVLDGSFEYSNMKVEPDYIYIFRWSLHTVSYSFDGCLNDVRIYDNVLSHREVNELSKALIIHYTLSSQIGSENLCVNSNNITTSNFVLTRSTAEGNTITLTPTTSASYAKYKASNLLYSDYKNKTYTLSFYIRRIKGENDSYTDKQSNIYIGLNIPSRINNAINSNYDKYVLVDSLTDIPNDWEYHSVTCAVPDDLKSGKDDAIADTSMVTFQFTNAASGTPVQIKSIKFEIGDKATPWSPNPADAEYSAMGYDDGIEYDVSGYGHNGVKVGTPTPCIDSPRYTGALKFGSGKYIHTDQAFYDVLKYTKPTGLTISIWAKMDTWAAREYNQMMVSCQQVGGFALYVTASGGFAFQIGTGESKNTYKRCNTDDLFTVSDIGDGWHLFTGTYDGLVSKLYIDGNFIKSGTEYTTVTPVFYYKGVTNIFVGGEAKASYTASDANYYFNGYLSDCRLYHTALTADEIADLYHTPISLSNSGTLLTQGELLEV